MKSILINALNKRHWLSYIAIILVIFLYTTSAFAQYENNNWAIHYLSGLSFTTQPASSLATKIKAPFKSATVSDANGNLLFYTNGISVWDKNNNVMPNGDSIIHTVNVLVPDGGDAFIVPDPAGSLRYYIFTAPTLASLDSMSIAGPPTIRYSIVDMSLNGGLGDVVPNAKNKILDTNVSSTIAVAGYGMCDKWLVMHASYSNQFKAYHITASGISAPVVSAIGDSVNSWIAMMKFANNNQKLVVRCYGLVTRSFLEAFDFNYQTGVVSNPVMVDTLSQNSVPNLVGTIGAGAIEFSPDCQKLYAGVTEFGKTRQDQANIYQYDLSLPTTVDIQNSKTLVALVDSFSEMQLTPQNNIFITTGIYGSTIAAILYPDKEAPACNLVGNYLTMPYLDSNFYITGCMANLVPASHVLYNHGEVYACQYPMALTAQVPDAGNYLWNTGAATRSININQPGAYWVKSLQACGAWRIDTFHVQSVSAPQSLPDSISCNGQPVQYVIHTPGSITWSNGSHDSVFTATQSGVYWVQTRVGQCTFKDTFRITIYPPLNISLLPADTAICNQSMTAFVTAAGNFDNYLWNTGATTQSININQPGTYWVSSTTVCGVYSDTMTVHFCPPLINSFTTSKDTICSGSCISFQASFDHNPTQFDWHFEGGNPATLTGIQTPLICYDTAGTFKASVIVSNNFGADTASLFITVLPKPDPRFRDTIIVTPYKTELSLPACAAATETDWYDEKNNLVCANCTTLNLLAKDWQKKYYCVTRNADCADTCFYKITVTNIPADAWLPDAFTPNGDGLNDYFHLITDNPNIEIADLAIYDRWGTGVYHSQENTKGWDGTYAGKQLQAGVYFWYLRYWVLGAGERKMYTSKGDVTLIR